MLLPRSRRRPLAACVSSMFVLAAPAATLAATVTSCLDDNIGATLRSVVTGAGDAEIIDFVGLDCTSTGNKIVLSNGPIYINQNSMFISGYSAAGPLTIDASNLPRGLYTNRVLTHNNTGGLTLTGLTITGGYVKHQNAPSTGGCIAASGPVALNSVTITNCYSGVLGSGTPTGGAISVAGNLTLNNSTISHGTAKGNHVLGGGAYVTGDLNLINSGSITENNAIASTGSALGGGAYVKGKLTLDYSGITQNTASSDSDYAKGGGAYVVGNLGLSNTSTLGANYATGTNVGARGAGAYTKGDLTMTASIVTNNVTRGPSESSGGGLFVNGNSSISYSTIKYNKAYGFGRGGGVVLFGPTNTISSSTVSNNYAYVAGGGVNVPGTKFTLQNSTISGNSTARFVGGLVISSSDVKLFNSTVAFNTAAYASGFSPGVVLDAVTNSIAVDLQSMLISNNTDLTATPQDLSISENAPYLVTFNGGNLDTPANNLIFATQVSKLPTDTKTGAGACPLLGPLRDNGGLTATHALMSGSPAIDTGNDSSLPALYYDQRGSAAVNGTTDYTRSSGMTAIADIGAYEVQQSDIVFNTAFEGCSL
jgi:hypothetical protein